MLETELCRILYKNKLIMCRLRFIIFISKFINLFYIKCGGMVTVDK